MPSSELSVITGAFGYTGSYIARRLLSTGGQVKSLTGHPDRPNPLGQAIDVAPLDFDNPSRLAGSLEGAGTLYNTYWIRFARGDVTFERAVRNTATLIGAAEAAGVRRIVHVSITGASADSRLPYFRGKWLAEEAVRASSLSHAIIRPTVIFGKEDVLINNIAWALRRLPVFAVFGRGDYPLQPVFVEDVARIAVTAGQDSVSETIEAVGPETFTYEELVRLIAGAVGSRARLSHLRPGLALALTKIVGVLVRDVVITVDEIEGLMAGLLVGSAARPTGETLLSQWLAENARHLGATYRSELRRHYR